MARETGPSSIFKEGIARRNQDGSFNEASIDKLAFAKKYSLRAEEAKKTVEFVTPDGKEFTGTLAEMLDDARCPVGGMIERANKRDGFSGVEQALNGLSMLYGTEINISEDTVKMNLEGTLMEGVEQEIAQDQKKNQNQNQTQVFPQNFL